METLALPLLVDRDTLRLVTNKDPVDSVTSAIRVMAQSPAATWAHAPWFGLQEAFAGVNPKLEDHPALADAVNRALAELDVRWIRVAEVKLVRGDAPGTLRFDLTLLTADGTAMHRRIAP